jgi:hypothetical protein
MDRDNNGRFVKGVSGNPRGRLPKPKEEQYYRVLVTRCTNRDWKAIIDKAIEQAKRGDAVARKWLADYIVGPPKQDIDVTSAGLPLKGYAIISPDDWNKDADES